MTTTQETTDRCDIDKVQVGSVWTRHDSGKVIGIRGHKIDLRNDAGDTWEITSSLVERQFSFADQHEQKIAVSRTEMIGILKANVQTAMTVVYRKKPDAKAAAKELAGGQGSMTTRSWNKMVRDLFEGEERTMVGHHYGEMDSHDRLKFREHGKGHRLVDTRTLKKLIVNRIEYVLK